MANCISLSRLAFFLVIPTSLCSVKLKEFEDDAVNDIMVDLSRYVMENYMVDGQGCVTIISETTQVNDFQDYNATSLIRITFDSSMSEDCDDNLKFKLAPCFVSYCSNYIVQISKPICFIAAWNEANYEFPELKHNPRMLFLPLSRCTLNYGEALYAFNGTDVSADILVAEYVKDGENGTDDWYVNVYSNNFYEHPSQPGRTGRILMDKWLPGQGFGSNTYLFPDKARNLQGKELKVFVIDYPPYTLNQPLDGIEVQLVKLFCEISNCSIISIIDDDEWGHINPTNNTATGCSGQVYIGNADICIGANYAWIRYWPFLDFSTAYYSGELTVIVPKPKALGGWSTPFLPFSAVLWASVVFCTIISTVGLHGITMATFKYVPSYQKKLVENDKFLTLGDSFIRTQKPIENIHDLADSNTIWMGNSDAYVLMIKYSDDPKTLKAVDNYRILPDEQIIALGESRGYGIVTEKLIGGHFVEQPFITDKFVESSITMKQAYVHSQLFAYLKKGSAYRKRLDQVIGRTLNAGLMYKWEDDSSAKLLDYSKQQKLLASTRKVTYPPKVLKVSDLEGAFLVYFVGIFFSIVLFIAEVYHVKKKRAALVTTK